MLTCITRPKHQHGNNSLSHHHHHGDPDSFQNPNNKHALKTLTSQIKEIALKGSGAYKCNPGQGPTRKYPDPEFTSGSGQDKSRHPWTYRRTHSSSAGTPRWGKELEARLKGMSVGAGGEMTAAMTSSASGRRIDPVVLVMEESEPKEWVAQVEPGVLITFVSLPRGGNHLKRIRFRPLYWGDMRSVSCTLCHCNRDMFDKWQAQKWWTENYEKVMELYNVQRLSRQAFPLPTPPISEDENSKMESIGDIPVTPPLTKESLPRSLYHGMGYSSSDSLEQQSKLSRQYNESSGLASTPKDSNISAVTAKTEASSMDDQSMRSTSSRDADQCGEFSISNASDMETEWVEEDEPGVYITIRALPGGRRELRRVRFSREKFGEMHARVWWEENRARIHEQYL